MKRARSAGQPPARGEGKRAAAALTAAVPAEHRPPPPAVAARGGETLLDQAREYWRAGDWEALSHIQADLLTSDPDRARVALLAATGHQHAGDIDAAQRFGRLALRWGCSRQLVARVLLASVHDGIAVAVATRGGEAETVTKHFVEAARLSGDHQPDSAGRMRGIRELARNNLIAEAMSLLQAEVGDLRGSASAPKVGGNDARMTMLESRLELLQGGLLLAQRRRQLDPVSAAVDQPIEHLSTSQLGQDLWVLERTGHKRGGFFVEFGATDGVLLSNTYLLEQEFGWSGICAEPNPKLFEQLCANRRCKVSSACIGSRTGSRVDFILADAYGGIADFAAEDSHADKREAFRQLGAVTTMTTVSLNDFLVEQGAPRHIDYLSIDTEGSEFDILDAFPFDAWTIDLITVEHNYSARRDSIRALLERHGFRCEEHEWDDWYSRVIP